MTLLVPRPTYQQQHFVSVGVGNESLNLSPCQGVFDHCVHNPPDKLIHFESQCIFLKLYNHIFSIFFREIVKSWQKFKDKKKNAYAKYPGQFDELWSLYLKCFWFCAENYSAVIRPGSGENQQLWVVIKFLIKAHLCPITCFHTLLGFKDDSQSLPNHFLLCYYILQEDWEENEER